MASELLKCIDDLSTIGFRVRGVVSDNHSTNVCAFKNILENHEGDRQHFIKLPDLDHKIYLFFDSVHLVKNVRNNLLNGKKFVFPGFNFYVGCEQASTEPGSICWQNLRTVHERDSKLKAHLRKAPKLSFKAIHPQDKKQNVNLALAIFDDKTIAAVKSYLPERTDIINFLKVINMWWTI